MIKEVEGKQLESPRPVQPQCPKEDMDPTMPRSGADDIEQHNNNDESEQAVKPQLTGETL